MSAIDVDVVIFVALAVTDQGKVRSPSNFVSVRVAMETRWLEVETSRVIGGNSSGHEIRQMVEEVLSALPKDEATKDSARILPMGGSRGRADELPPTAMLQWP